MNSPIRILHVIGKMDRGGAETMMMNLYRQIDRTKIQFDFMVHTNEIGAFDSEILALGGKIFRVPTYKGKNHAAYKKSWISFFETQPEYKVIHAHLTTTAAIFLRIAKKYGMVTIAHAHNNTPISKGIKAFVKNGLRYPLRYIADYFFACSHAAGFRLYGRKFEQHENCFVFENAFNVNEFAYDPTMRKQKRVELGIENKFVIGHVGRFALVKNHPFLIEIFEAIKAQQPNAALLLVGDGRERQNVEQKVAELGLSSSVIFLGVRHDIPELLQAMDVFIFPSFYEGFPVSLIEAQTSGLSCLVSDTITDEVALTPLVRHLSLKRSAAFWANMATKNFEKEIREDMTSTIKAAGYDIKETTSWLHHFYTKIHKQKQGDVG